MTIKDIYTCTEEFQKVLVLDVNTSLPIYKGKADDIPMGIMDRWIDRVTCTGATLIITIDPE